MSLDDIIASYIEQQRCLGKRFAREATILAAFKNAVGDVPLRDIRSEMISVFVNRGGTSDATRHRKYRVVAGLFRFAVTRRFLKASPLPPPLRLRHWSSYTPYIYSGAELKRFSQRFRRQPQARAASSMRTRCAHSCCSCTAPHCGVAKRCVLSSEMWTWRNRWYTFEGQSSSRHASSL